MKIRRIQSKSPNGLPSPYPLVNNDSSSIICSINAMRAMFCVIYSQESLVSHLVSNRWRLSNKSRSFFLGDILLLVVVTEKSKDICLGAFLIVPITRSTNVERLVLAAQNC